MLALEENTTELSDWLTSPRFKDVVRLHTARQVGEQLSVVSGDHVLARKTAEAFFTRLRELFASRRSMTTFGPYSPGQAVVMRRLGVEGIYLGGWATSAKGGVTEDPGADLASYPLSQVPDEASAIVRALVTADRNQHFARARMTAAQRAETPIVDYRPFIIADADTGHGGDAHVRNLIRRFVEVGVPGYHIEDQKPGVKKCGHQGGKVLVSQNEQIQRLNAARFQLDVMRVPGLIVARTDAEAANLIDSCGDERDQPYILGVANPDAPTCKAVIVALHQACHGLGWSDIRGHLMFGMSPADLAGANTWFETTGLRDVIRQTAASVEPRNTEAALDALTSRVLDEWQRDAGLKTYADAVSAVIKRRAEAGEPAALTADEWQDFAANASWQAARARARDAGIDVFWDAERAKTPEGYYQIKGGLAFAIARSLTAAPFADLLWMETATPDIEEARAFASAIHARFPDKMLAYNLSPSFNWDGKGLSDDDMRQFPGELARLGFVFNFITYGGHQIDGLAAEDFTRALQRDGMLALARLQRKLRLLESPYRTPQALAGGPRLDAALMACSGRTATTKAMGQGSTHHQHLREIEASPTVLEAWLRQANPACMKTLTVKLEPAFHDSEGVEVSVRLDGQRAGHIVVQSVRDGRGRRWLVVVDQCIGGTLLPARTTATLMTLFLLKRYQPVTVQYLSPAGTLLETAADLESLGAYDGIATLSDVAAARVSADRVNDLTRPGQVEQVVSAITRRANAAEAVR